MDKNSLWNSIKELHEIIKLLESKERILKLEDDINTRFIMLDVIIALLPTTIWGILRFGIHALLVIVLAVISAIISETLFNIIVKKPNTIGDLSCVVTGLILALNMPPEIPLFIPIVGSVFAIIIAKMLFGGLGQNFINPALAGRCFCHISFTAFMNNFKSTTLFIKQFTNS